MSDNPHRIFLIIFQLNLSDEDILKLRVHLILHQSDGKLLLVEHIIVIFAFRKISVAFDLTFFYQFAKHVYRLHLILFNHSPEVVNCNGEGSLGRYYFFLLDFYHICVDVVLDGVFLSQFDSGWLEGHESGMSVQRKLFWVFVQFVNVLLGLGHEGQQLKLGAGAAVDAL